MTGKQVTPASLFQRIQRLSRILPSKKSHNPKQLKLSRQTVLLFFLAALTGKQGEISLIYLSVLLHELAHLGACKITGIATSHIAVYPYGMKLQLKEIASPSKQIFISASGPLVNLILFFIGRALMCVYHSTCRAGFFASSNLLLFLFNMLPCIPLDGSEILRSVISSKKGIIYSYSVVLNISKAIMLIIFFCGMILAASRGNISLLIVLAVLIKNIRTKKQEQLLTAKNIILQTINSKNKPKVVCAKNNCPAYTLIKHISFCYTLIILRENQPPLSQQKLLDAVRQNPSVKIGDI